MKLLVHACCGPCSIVPTRLLSEQGYDLTVFYANSNIAPKDEYDKRLGELVRYADSQGFSVVEGEYNPEAWERDVAPIGEAIKDLSPAFSSGFAESSDTEKDAKATNTSVEVLPALPRTVAELLDDENRRERCRACYRLRLEESAHTAAAAGYDALSTTLAVSPYQFTDLIHEELERACERWGVEPLFQDFRPYYNEATRISRELGMYRQNYCGCRFSIREGQATREFIKRQRAQQKAERAQARAAEEDKRRLHAEKKREYAERQARKRAVLKQLREDCEGRAR